MDKIKMGTAKKLFFIYGKTHLTLEQAVEEFLPHLSHAAARRRANNQSLPWPVIETEPSQKASRVVSINAIAKWLDEQEEKANHEWKKVNQ